MELIKASLSIDQLRLYNEMDSNADYDGLYQVSVRKLAEKCNMSYAKAAKYRNELHDRGLIKIIIGRRGGKGSKPDIIQVQKIISKG
jgi:DNA-binding IscR family transcriptional regulator